MESQLSLQLAKADSPTRLEPLDLGCPQVTFTDSIHSALSRSSDDILIAQTNTETHQLRVETLPALVMSSTLPSAYKHIEKRFTRSYLARREHIALLPKSLVCCDQTLTLILPHSYWKDSLYLPDWRSWPFIQAIDNSLFLHPKTLNLATVSDPSAVFSARMASNYYHWHINVLPAVLSLRSHITDGSIRAFFGTLSHWQHASLKLLNVENVERSLGCEHVLFERLVFSSYMSNIAFAPPARVAGVFSLLKRNSIAHHGTDSLHSPIKVFVSRRDSASRRPLDNERALEQALRNIGFVTVVPAEMSYSEQIEVFSNADIVVAQHGAALTNIGFCQPNAAIVEILSPNYANTCYWRLAQLCQLRYTCVFADIVDDYNPSYRHLTVAHAPIAAVLQAVSEMGAL